MKLIYTCFLALAIALGSCSKSTPEKSDGFCLDYERGDIFVRLHTNTATAFSFFNEKGLTIKTMGPNDYASALPIDSMNYVVGILRAKPYFNVNNFDEAAFAQNRNGVITLHAAYSFPTKAAQNDWLQTMTLLQLTELQPDQGFLITVPEGQEKSWVVQLRLEAVVADAELHCILTLD